MNASDHSSRVAAALAKNASCKRDSNGMASSSLRSKVPRGNMPRSINAPDNAAGSMLVPPQISGSVMASKKCKVSWPSGSMTDILGEQAEEIASSPCQSPFAPQVTKKHKVSWPSGSMEEILGELEETASSPCQTPLAPQLNHDGSTRKKKRGPTRCLKTHGLRYEDRFPIRLNSLGQPIGHYRATLSTYLGTLARNAHLAPLTYTSWKALKANWEDMWETVTSKFNIEECAKKWVLQTICSSWRGHKCRLKKKYFKPNMIEGYNLKNRPAIVPLEQWRILIKYWKSELTKARSKKNRISRAKQTSMHTTGSKSFAEIREEEKEKNPNGREPSRVEMYLITHKPKNGKPMNDGTSRIVSKLEEAATLHPEASEISTAQDDIFSQVMGKDRPGHVRTYGKGVVPSDLWGTRSQLETQKVIEEVKKNAQAEIQNIQEKMQEEMQVKLQEQVEAIKTEMFSGFKMVLTQLQKCLPGVVIPDLPSMSIPNINEGQVVDARSSVVTHHSATKKQNHTTFRNKKSKEGKTHKKRREKGLTKVVA